jgi:hypothetical protein
MEVIPFDNAVGKYFDTCDINPGENAIQFGNSIRSVVDADPIDADVPSLEIQAINQNPVCEFGYDIIFDLKIRQALGQPLRQVSTGQVSHDLSFACVTWATVAFTLSLLD